MMMKSPEMLQQNTPTTSVRHTKQCSNSPILALPDELLDPILELSCPPETYSEASLAEHCNARTLMQVCRRFHLIARPILYRSIQSWPSTQFSPPSQSVQLLHLTISQNRSLSAHCRHLQIYASDSDGWPRRLHSLSIASDVVSWFTNVRSLTIHGGFNVNSCGNWRLVHQAVNSMPHL